MDGALGFKDKVALVVGGASGMGNAVVRLLRAEACRTHVLDVKETADGAFQQCDVRDYSQVQRCIQNVMEREGRIDLLFVAAGVHLFANIEDTSIDEFERVLSINTKGPFYVLKEVLPVMRKQRYGNVVLMGSDQVFIGKAAGSVRDEQGGRGAAHQEKRQSTTPLQRQGQLHLPGHDRYADGRADRRAISSGQRSPIDAINEMLRKAQPIQRLGTPEEIGRAVLFLLSDDCPFMTGALVSADGGYTCQ